MNDTTPKQIRINNDELAALKKIALEQDRSVSSVIRLAIKDYLNTNSSTLEGAAKSSTLEGATELSSSRIEEPNSKGPNTALDCPEIQKDEESEIPF